MSIDKAINNFFSPISDVANAIIFYDVPLPFTDVELKLILVWLAFAGVFFTFYFHFINFRLFTRGFQILKQEYDNKDKKVIKEGQISCFEALSTSLSGTVGLGNIAGVAVAVSIGGPGAVLWMIVMGFFAMSTKFAEVSLSVKYRTHNDPSHPETISGGPMYYIKKAFEHYNLPKIGVVVAVIFAVSCIGGAIGAGNMFQSNQAYHQLLNVTGGDASFFADKGWLFGVGLAVLVGAVILGGIKSIAHVASKLVPAMGILYMLTSFIVIFMHAGQIPSALWTILDAAISFEAGLGGVIGAILIGVQRAAFSNEAGLGSAAIVHANACTDCSVSQGIVGMLGPFFDTIVICLTTALLIVVTGVYQNADGVEGVALTSAAMEQGVDWFKYTLALCVFLFAFSTLISWFYYGLKAFTFLFGSNDVLELCFKMFFCLCVILGASAELGSIISFADAMLLAMGIPNIIGLYLLAPELKKDLRNYLANFKKLS